MLSANEIAANMLSRNCHAFIIVDSDGNIKQHNEEAEHMFVKQNLHSPDKKVDQFIYEVFGQQWQRIICQKTEVSYYLTAYLGTKSEFPVELNLFKIQLSGDNYTVLSFRNLFVQIAAEKNICRLNGCENLFNKVALKYFRSTDLESFLQGSIQIVGETLAIERTAIWNPDFIHGNIKLMVEWCANDINSHNYSDSLTYGGIPYLWKTVLNSNLIRINDAGILPEPDYTTLYNKNIKSILGLPIMILDRIWGIFYLQTSYKRFWLDEEVNILISLVDIIQNFIKVAETKKELKESEARYRNIFENRGVASLILNEDLTIVKVNSEFERLFAYGKDEVEDKKNFLSLLIKDDMDAVIRNHHPGMDNLNNKPASYETHFVDKYGNSKNVLLHISFLENGESIVSILDTTQLKKASRARETISACDIVIVGARNVKELLIDVCRNIIHIGEYELAWVTCNKDEEEINVMSGIGYQNINGAASVTNEWGYTKLSINIIGTAIQSREITICQNIEADSSLVSLLSNDNEDLFKSVIALPLIFNNKIIGAISIYSRHVDAFDIEQTRLLSELADNLAYGIASLDTRILQRKSEEKLKDSLKRQELIFDELINAIGTIIEARDPYTAEHQRRVAKLAEAIASEMGLSDDQIKGVQVAGLLHDIGKIIVPAEILSKPGELNQIEFGLIKAHPQVGHDILRGIGFRWPIAKIIFQHHERIDGSGYPLHILGGDILLESRILAVADVMEAMSSHRPYRAALGIDRAIEEISLNKGILYDPLVADSCIRILRDKNFKFA